MLVRPDYFVAWRAVSGGNEEARLKKVTRAILCCDDQSSKIELFKSRPR